MMLQSRSRFGSNALMLMFLNECHLLVLTSLTETQAFQSQHSSSHVCAGNLTLRRRRCVFLVGCATMLGTSIASVICVAQLLQCFPLCAWFACVMHASCWPRPQHAVAAGVPEPYDVRAKSNEEAGLLSISKLRFQELTSAYPEQLESMITSLLDQYGLTRTGDDKQANGAHASAAAQQENETEVMRVELKVCINRAWQHH